MLLADGAGATDGRLLRRAGTPFIHSPVSDASHRQWDEAAPACWMRQRQLLLTPPLLTQPIRQHQEKVHPKVSPGAQRRHCTWCKYLPQWREAAAEGVRREGGGHDTSQICGRQGGGRGRPRAAASGYPGCQSARCGGGQTHPPPPRPPRTPGPSWSRSSHRQAKTKEDPTRGGVGLRPVRSSRTVSCDDGIYLRKERERGVRSVYQIHKF